MNLFENGIDRLALEKISQMLNSPKGNELKKQLENIDKDSLVKMFNNLNISQNDVENFSEKIRNTSQEELLNEISRKLRR